MLRILLIEDNEDDALLFERAVKDTGTVETADTLEAGLDRAGSDSFDLVVLDLSLPDAHGPEAVRRCRAHLGEQQRLIVLTGSNDEKTGTAALDAGADQFLVKGQVDRSTLQRALRSVLPEGPA